MSGPSGEIPPTMRALRLHRAGDPASLVVEDVGTPRAKQGEALVRVFAAAITRGELDWPANRLPAIPSYEVSGVVVASEETGGIGVGERVYGLSAFDRDGAAADYVAVSAAYLAPKPKALGHIESAAVPLAALSAWQGLFVHGKLEDGQRVIIHGAAGGVGAFAVQLAHHHGAHVIGTASAAGADVAIRLGADQVIDPAKTRFEEGIEPVDLVFDTAGGERLKRSPAVLRQGGRLVSVAEEPSISAGITAIYFVVEPNREQLQELTRLIDGGHLRPIIDKVYPLTEARRAFERSLGAHGAGKIVLRVADEEE